MNIPAIWKRPHLSFPLTFDTIFFDVDGVLIKTKASFQATAIAVAEYVVGIIHGLDWGQNEGKSLVTIEDVEVFKRAGGFNDDILMGYLLASLLTARLREWKLTMLAERSTQEWAELARTAQLQGHGGREWVEAVLPASARIDYSIINDLYHEIYWGAEELRMRFGRELRYLSHAEGLIHNEEMLYSADFFARLRTAGLVHMGMITGRFGQEVNSVLERMIAYSGEPWWDVVVCADLYKKPDPQALRFAITAVGTEGGLYIGDTADDFDLVRNYRASQLASEPDILMVMVAQEDEVMLYQQRGADIIVRSVEDLLTCLPVRTQM
ncbi:MAG TPA: HAD family hydrolase [Ktedonobacteraceae bacterium]|jgi:phosphoglycolate phosphatase-like HAD superfamily hydrolase